VELFFISVTMTETDWMDGWLLWLLLLAAAVVVIALWEGRVGWTRQTTVVSAQKLLRDCEPNTMTQRGNPNSQQATRRGGGRCGDKEREREREREMKGGRGRQEIDSPLPQLRWQGIHFQVVVVVLCWWLESCCVARRLPYHLDHF
jgi:hypothetical protein